MKRLIAGLTGIVLAGLVGIAARADTLTWTGMTGDWFAVENWTNTTAPESTRVPAAGDEAVVNAAGAEVWLTDSTERLGSLEIASAKLVFSNWDTLLSATGITVKAGGVLTCSGPFTNGAVSNRVNLLCTNLLIEAGGAIDVQAKGYSGGLTTNTGGYAKGHGPGALSSGSASHGGMGLLKSFVIPSNTYGEAEAPLFPGSGGAGGNRVNEYGGHGGGAVRIEAVDVVVNGAINADASLNPFPLNGVHSCGGSGGSVYITCETISGAGSVTARGGHACLVNTTYLGCGGAGGRIAILYDSGAQAAVTPAPAFRCSTEPGMSDLLHAIGPYTTAEPGTLYFPDSVLFSSSNLFSGTWLAPGLPAELILADWTVSNVCLRIPGMKITVSNTLTIAGTNYPFSRYGQFRLEMTNAGQIACGQLRIDGGALSLGAALFPYFYPNWDTMSGGPTGSTLTCAGDLVVTNGGRLFVFAGLTNSGTASGYGAKVTAGGDILSYSNCWIYPVAHPTNGAVPLFTVSNLTVNRFGGFDANAMGFGGGLRSGATASNTAWGPGSNGHNAGASHGGMGTIGGYSGAPGVTYGDPDAPILPGSGARCGYTTSVFTPYYGPWGGGSVQIRALGTVALYGLMTASGTTGVTVAGGGSSGGSIYITCGTFLGDTNGVLQANGGLGAYGSQRGGGGGGGRIAVWRKNDLSGGLVSNYVAGGLGYSLDSAYTNCLTGGPGTVVYGWLPVPGTVIRFR